jgi:uncharacterized alpha-E superfamily protein
VFQKLLNIGDSIMLDPVTSLSVACNILQVLEQGWMLLYVAEEVYHSTAGATQKDSQLESVLDELSRITSKFSPPTGQRSGDEKELYNIAQKCEKLMKEIRDILQVDQAKNPKSKKQSLSLQRGANGMIVRNRGSSENWMNVATYCCCT